MDGWTAINLEGESSPDKIRGKLAYQGSCLPPTHVIGLDLCYRGHVGNLAASDLSPVDPARSCLIPAGPRLPLARCTGSSPLEQGQHPLLRRNPNFGESRPIGWRNCARARQEAPLAIPTNHEPCVPRQSTPQVAIGTLARPVRPPTCGIASCSARRRLTPQISRPRFLRPAGDLGRSQLTRSANATMIPSGPRTYAIFQTPSYWPIPPTSP